LERPGGWGYGITARTVGHRPLIGRKKMGLLFRPKEEEDIIDWIKLRSGELRNCTLRKYCLHYGIKENWFDKSCTRVIQKVKAKYI